MKRVRSTNSPTSEGHHPPRRTCRIKCSLRFPDLFVLFESSSFSHRHRQLSTFGIFHLYLFTTVTKLFATKNASNATVDPPPARRVQTAFASPLRRRRSSSRILRLTTDALPELANLGFVGALLVLELVHVFAKLGVCSGQVGRDRRQ